MEMDLYRGKTMNLAEITHRAYFLDCYPLDERHLKISIQTGKDVDEVILWAVTRIPPGLLRTSRTGRASGCRWN